MDELVDFVVSFEGLQERHRQFLLGFIEARATELLGIKPLDMHRKELQAALDKSKRIANQRNITETERRLMIRDVLAPYLKASSTSGTPNNNGQGTGTRETLHPLPVSSTT